MSERFVDILVVGAGLSGVTAGCRLKKSCPETSFVIIEAREALGGTWDLFRYPGIRSDSDMYTFGFSFEPWKGDRSVADGPEIRRYIADTATKYGVDSHIRYESRVVKADWVSTEQNWQVVVCSKGKQTLFHCRFLWVCSGYYSYDGGYRPELPGLEDFKGRVVHPQEWPEDLDYAGQNVVIVGSGATAVTLLPALANDAGHVTLLQRSPGYVSEIPRVDPWVKQLNRILPYRLAAWLLRWKGVLYQSFVFWLARTWPTRVTELLLKPLAEQFNQSEIEEHFTPRYNPWEQRLCVDSDGEYLKALSSDRASIVTDRIAGFTERSVQTESGSELEADILVTATGLVVELFGKIELTVDGAAVKPADHLVYKGAMLNDVPNMIFSLGYTNMSWTLKCDLTARYVCRLIKFMSRNGFRTCCPRLSDPKVRPLPLIDFSSGYLTRATSILPRQGSKSPWKLHQSYLADLIQTEFAGLDDGTMEFS